MKEETEHWKANTGPRPFCRIFSHAPYNKRLRRFVCASVLQHAEVEFLISAYFFYQAEGPVDVQSCMSRMKGRSPMSYSLPLHYLLKKKVFIIIFFSFRTPLWCVLQSSIFPLFFGGDVITMFHRHFLIPLVALFSIHRGARSGASLGGAFGRLFSRRSWAAHYGSKQHDFETCNHLLSHELESE